MAFTAFWLMPMPCPKPPPVITKYFSPSFSWLSNIQNVLGRYGVLTVPPFVSSVTAAFPNACLISDSLSSVTVFLSPSTTTLTAAPPDTLFLTYIFCIIPTSDIFESNELLKSLSLTVIFHL